MTADLDRKIVTVRYNLLNLPDTIQYYDGSMTVNHYLADGTRLSSVHHTVLDGVVVPVGSVCNVDTIANVTTSGSAYCQNIEYEMQADGTPAISRVFNSEGFIAGILPTAQAAYYCRDAQGNITSVWRVDAGYPYQTTHYNADGHIKNNSTGTSFQPYLYSGKELQRMHGYDCYDYGARHSQTSLGRFTTIDPLAERYYDISPYVLCGGNPVRYVDWDGCESRSWEDKFGDWMRDTFNSHSEIQEAKNIQPVAEGVALLNPVIGIANDITTLSTDNDIYGNQASSLDKGIATVDMLSFGTSKVINAISTTTKLGATTTIIEKVSSGINKSTTYFSVISTTIKGYLNEKK